MDELERNVLCDEASLGVDTIRKNAALTFISELGERRKMLPNSNARKLNSACMDELEGKSFAVRPL